MTNILIITNNADVATPLQKALEKSGCECLIAQEKPPHFNASLILIDPFTPKMRIEDYVDGIPVVTLPIAVVPWQSSTKTQLLHVELFVQLLESVCKPQSEGV